MYELGHSICIERIHGDDLTVPGVGEAVRNGCNGGLAAATATGVGVVTGRAFGTGDGLAAATSRELPFAGGVTTGLTSRGGGVTLTGTISDPAGIPAGFSSKWSCFQ